MKKTPTKDHSMIGFTTLLALLLLSTATPAHGQQFNITGGTATSCSGVIEDSGGPTGPYSDNENHTFTICPDVPGSSIVLTWIVFDLSTAGAGIDNMTIFDGDDVTAPTLGTYTGTQLANLTTAATVINGSGCLTLVFLSNSTGTGQFACGISCAQNCDPPTAMATMSLPSPAYICSGSTVQFDASGSTPGPGQVISAYHWQFGQTGFIEGTEPTLTYTFDDPGIFPVILTVIDTNGCASTNAVDLEVVVSTTPVLSISDLDSVYCVGDAISLAASIDPVPWSANSVDYGGGIYLPDDVGLPFTSQLDLTGFPPGSVVGSTGDISSICVDIEHTYMGDLVLQVICPNGSTITLHEQGGGGTYLGAPDDFDNNSDPVIGECWHYCWSSTATNGTWADNSVGGSNNTTLAGNPPNNSLNADTYEAVGTWSSLIGCPLNGTWTFQSTDLWGADNGFLCGWEVHFDTSLGGDTNAFVPAYGAGCDSSFWSGNGINWADAGCDSIVVSPLVAGLFDLTYTAINDFGCVFDTTVIMTVLSADDAYCLTLGVPEGVQNTIQLFPMPANDRLEVRGLPPGSFLALYDIRGSQILSGGPVAASGTEGVQLHGLAPGVYVLSVQEVGRNVRFRVVKR